MVRFSPVSHYFFGCGRNKELNYKKHHQSENLMKIVEILLCYVIFLFHDFYVSFIVLIYWPQFNRNINYSLRLSDSLFERYLRFEEVFKIWAVPDARNLVTETVWAIPASYQPLFCVASIGCPRRNGFSSTLGSELNFRFGSSLCQILSFPRVNLRKLQRSNFSFSTFLSLFVRLKFNGSVVLCVPHNFCLSFSPTL